MTPAGAHALRPQTARLLATAVRAISTHVSGQGLRTACGAAFPCRRAELAELTLGWLFARRRSAGRPWSAPGTALAA